MRILGDYWDIFTVDNKVYIWGFDGSVICLDWEKLKEYLKTNETVVELKDIKNSINGIYQNPFKELHTDFATYNNKIYAVLDEGLYSATINTNNTNNSIKTETVEKIWDCPLFALKIKSNGRVALAGGEEGLFQYDILKKETGYIYKFHNYDSKIDQISKDHSSFVNWAHSSIFSSSNRGESYLAGFYWKDGQINYKGILNESEIFGKNNSGEVSWAYRGNIYRTTSNGLEYISFTQQKLQGNRQGQPFSEVKKVPFMPYKGKPLFAEVSMFGSIIECENALVVMENEKSFFNIPEPPTRWRVYPEDAIFKNHLHVIFEDYLKLYVF